MTVAELRRRLDDGPMSPAQMAAVATVVAISALDGYDVLSASFAAPALSHELALGKAALGTVLSSGLAGMAIGSLLLAPLADRAGRRPVVVGALVLMAAGMLLAAFASTRPGLSLCRGLTGLGIGACVAVINPLAAEFANARRRPLAVAMMAVGYPAGGVVGGLLSAWLLHVSGWRSVFAVGAVIAAALVPVVLLLLPEPLDFLLSRPGGDALPRINRLMDRLGQPRLRRMPTVSHLPRNGFRLVVAPGQRSITIRLVVVDMLYAASVYFVLSWLPQLIADMGFSPSVASLVSTAASVAGIAGGLALGWTARWLDLRRSTALVMTGLGLAVLALGFAPPSIPILVALGGVAGLCLFSGAAGFYALLAESFEPAARATGAGLVMGAGRVSSAAGPVAAGWLLAAGHGRGVVSATFGVLALFSALLLHGLPRRTPRGASGARTGPP